jgi:hypothetical protein
MTSLERLKQAREKLVALESQHDQTIRTQATRIMHSVRDNKDGLNDTTRFLDAQIVIIDQAIQNAQIDEMED